MYISKVMMELSNAGDSCVATVGDESDLDPPDPAMDIIPSPSGKDKDASCSGGFKF